MNRQIHKASLLVIITATIWTCGCQRPVRSLRVEQETPPVAGTSLVPQATRLSSGRLLVSWQRPLESGGYSFEMAIRNGKSWSEVRTFASGKNLSMFTADLPAVVELPNGNLLAIGS